MSIPVNPLDKYRTYSYHHLMVVSNNSEDIRKFSGTDDNLITTKIHEAKLGEPINVGGSKNTYLVIDTAKMSQFSISDLSYIGFLGVGSLKQTQILGSEVLMTIIDESSIGFMNYMRYLIDEKLKTDINGMVFLIKTFFVGHTHDNKTEHITTSSTPMILMDLELDLSPQSFGFGVYSLKFIPLNNGAPLIKNTNNLMYDVSSIVAQNGKLKDVLKNFQDQINKRSREWYYNYQSKIATDGRISDSHVNKGRLVQIRITIPKEWEDFKVDGVKSKMTEIEHKMKEKAKEDKAAFEKKQQEQATATGNVSSEVFKSVTPNMSVYDVITEVLMMTSKVVSMHTYDKVQNGEVKTFKIVSTLTSDERSVIFHFNVIEVPIPDVDKIKGEDSTLKQRYFVKVDNVEIPKNGIIFDYIFTGKNSDILLFSVNLKNGYVGLMNTLEMGTESLENKNTVVTSQEKSTKEIETQKQPNVVYARDKEPIILPVRSADEKKNFAAATAGDAISTKKTQEMTNILSELHGMTNLDTKMTIRGNPSLMMKTVRQVVPPHIDINTTISGNKDQFINDVNLPDAGTAYDLEFLSMMTEDSQRGTSDKNLDVASLPLFVKVNIYGPAINEFGESSLDNKRIKGTPLERFSKQYWYKGWYLVREIHHRFTDGKFEQDLAMHAFEIYQKHSYNEETK